MSARAEYIAALQVERANLESRGLKARVAQVDAELSRYSDTPAVAEVETAADAKPVARSRKGKAAPAEDTPPDVVEAEQS